ncbi:MAG: MoaD/ThiS family protein [Burkholderiales bacterium]
MKIRLKLYAMLTDFLPQPAIRNEVTIDIDEDMTIDQVINRHKLPPEWVHLVLLNGVYVYPPERQTTRLRDGDALAIWPPIAGG